MEDFFAHFPSKVSQAIVDYATDVAFKWSRYIFTTRKGKQQYGYCTHCKREFKTPGLRHNNAAICPECQSKCIIKASGISRKRMIDEVYFVWYEKSTVNPQAIVATGVYAVRDYRGDYRRVESLFTTMAMYLFEPGSSKMLKRWAYYSGGKSTVGAWQESWSVHSLYNNGHILRINTYYSQESIQEAVKGTSFSWSGWEQYKHDDMVKFFDLYARYPCIEYLTKLGFKDLVKDKLLGNRTHSAINWRGKDLFSVLKITKQNLKDIKAKDICVTFEFLKILQMSRKDGSNFTPEEAEEVAIEYSAYINELGKIMKYGGLRKIINYFKKQRDKYPNHFHYRTSTLVTWRDYISDCIKLEMDLSKERVLFPKNLHRAHQNTIKQIKIKADEMLNKKISQRVKALNKYYFEYSGLIMRPAESSNELISEGKALNHCVGTYGQRYANGKTNIFVIRKTSEPDKPYFTVEIQQDNIRQCYGKDNCRPSQDVSEFIEAFKAQKLTRKKIKAAASA